MFKIKNNEKINKAMSLRGRAVGSDVVIFHAETNKAQSFLSRCCAGKKQKESSLVQRKSERQAIFKFVLSSASGGGKYNRIPAFVSMSVLLIGRSLEKIFKKIFRDDSLFMASPKDSLHRHPERSEGSIKNNIKDWILRFAKSQLVMTIPALALIFTLATTSESRAAKTCDCGYQGHESECCWEITEITTNGKTEKILTISPGVDANGNNLTSVVMKDFDAIDDQSDNYYTSNYKSSAPWARSNVTSVIVENGISNIGDHAFIGDTQIISVRGMNDVTTIGTSAFHQATSLENIDMPNVKVLGPWSFAGAASITSVDMPNIESISYSVFRGATSLNYIGFNPIKLTNENIGSEAFNFSYSLYSDIPLEIWANCDISTGQCGTCGTGYVMSGTGCVSNCGNGYLGKEGRCIDSSLGCGAGYRQFENFCNRIRYTPAEAAKVLRDDNTNEVTITFKK